MDFRSMLDTTLLKLRPFATNRKILYYVTELAGVYCCNHDNHYSSVMLRQLLDVLIHLVKLFCASL